MPNYVANINYQIYVLRSKILKLYEIAIGVLYSSKRKSEIIQSIENNFLSIEELKKVKTIENNEELVDLKTFIPSIVLTPQKANFEITGNTIYIRLTVAQKLKRVQERLELKGYGLRIMDGFRPIEIQTRYYNALFARNKQKFPDLSVKELENLTVKFCASPEMCFHPTGGAVDLGLIKLKTKRRQWMGNRGNYHYRSYSFYPILSKKALKNRKILFDEMEKENFYNLPSEWWHFSYGTVDWALYNKKPNAIYNVTSIKKIKET
ncbi:MAG: M15 family metallopeptidase [bacterium]